MTFGWVDSGLRVSSELASGTTFNCCRFLTTSPVGDSTAYYRGFGRNNNSLIVERQTIAHSNTVSHLVIGHQHWGNKLFCLATHSHSVFVLEHIPCPVLSLDTGREYSVTLSTNTFTSSSSSVLSVSGMVHVTVSAVHSCTQEFSKDVFDNVIKPGYTKAESNNSRW